MKTLKKSFKKYKQNKSKKLIGGGHQPTSTNDDDSKKTDNATIKDSVNKQLEEILTNPENIKKNIIIAEQVKTAAETGSKILDATKPFLGKLVDTTIEATSEAADKLGQAGLKVLLNTATEIPGVGVIVGTARSLDTIGKTIAEVTEASAKVVEVTADTVEKTAEKYQEINKGINPENMYTTLKNPPINIENENTPALVATGGGYKQLINKKKSIEKRINNSINEHLGGGKIKTRKLKRFLRNKSRNIPL